MVDCPECGSYQYRVVGGMYVAVDLRVELRQCLACRHMVQVEVQEILAADGRGGKIGKSEAFARVNRRSRRRRRFGA